MVLNRINVAEHVRRERRNSRFKWIFGSLFFSISGVYSTKYAYECFKSYETIYEADNIRYMPSIMEVYDLLVHPEKPKSKELEAELQRKPRIRRMDQLTLSAKSMLAEQRLDQEEKDFAREYNVDLDAWKKQQELKKQEQLKTTKTSNECVVKNDEEVKKLDSFGGFTGAFDGDYGLKLVLCNVQEDKWEERARLGVFLGRVVMENVVKRNAEVKREVEEDFMEKKTVLDEEYRKLLKDSENSLIEKSEKSRNELLNERTQQFSALRARMHALNAIELDSKVDIERFSDSLNETIELSALVNALNDAVSSGSSFEVEFQILKLRILQNINEIHEENEDNSSNKEFLGMLNDLSSQVDTESTVNGLPGKLNLSRRFIHEVYPYASEVSLVKSGVKSETGSENTELGMFWKVFVSKFITKLRISSEHSQDFAESNGVVLQKALKLMENSDGFETGVKELEMLDGLSKELVMDWMKCAKQQILIDTLLKLLASHLLLQKNALKISKF